MLCDNCKERESIISYTRINNDEVEEVHLCQVCAEEKFKKEFTGYQNIIPQLENALKNIFKFTANSSKDEKDDIKCEYCGRSFRELKNTGVLGCPKCYDSFGNEIKSYLKALNINLKYRGKIPKNADSYIYYNRKLEDLREKLNLAISLEEYEEAAEIRDEIKTLKEDANV